MSEENANLLTAFVILVALVVAPVVALGRGCGAAPPPPPTATVTATAEATLRPTATAVAERPTGSPTQTSQPTRTPQPAATATLQTTRTPRLTATPRTTTTPLPTVRPALRGVHVVARGETLWGIACEWYGDIPLLPGANPLTPCTCWRGVHAAGARVRPPQLIYPGERLAIPAVCGW